MIKLGLKFLKHVNAALFRNMNNNGNYDFKICKTTNAILQSYLILQGMHV